MIPIANLWLLVYLPNDINILTIEISSMYKFYDHDVVFHLGITDIKFFITAFLDFVFGSFMPIFRLQFISVFGFVWLHPVVPYR
jgi:hypothetical protein